MQLTIEQRTSSTPLKSFFSLFHREIEIMDQRLWAEIQRHYQIDPNKTAELVDLRNRLVSTQSVSVEETYDLPIQPIPDRCLTEQERQLFDALRKKDGFLGRFFNSKDRSLESLLALSVRWHLAILYLQMQLGEKLEHQKNIQQNLKRIQVLNERIVTFARASLYQKYANIKTLLLGPFEEGCLSTSRLLQAQQASLKQKDHEGVNNNNTIHNDTSTQEMTETSIKRTESASVSSSVSLVNKDHQEVYSDPNIDSLSNNSPQSLESRQVDNVSNNQNSEQEFIHAAEKNNITQLGRLLQSNPDLIKTHGKDAVSCAVRAGAKGMVVAFLLSKIPFEETELKEKWSRSILDIAIEFDRDDVLSILYEHNPNFIKTCGEQELDSAMNANAKRVIAFLLSKVSAGDNKLKRERSHFVLNRAIKYGLKDVLAILYEYNPDLFKTNHCAELLYHAIGNNEVNEEVIKFLLSKILKEEEFQKYWFDFISLAIHCDRKDIFDLLYQYGISSSDNQEALCFILKTAIRYDKVDIVDRVVWLIEMHPELKTRRAKRDESIFLTAARYSSLQVMVMLIEKGLVDWTEMDDKSNTVLHIVLHFQNYVISKSTQLIELLLCNNTIAQQGIKQANIFNAKNKEGKTPLYYAMDTAVNRDDIADVIILLKSGVDIQEIRAMKNAQEESFFLMAIRAGSLKVLAFLIEKELVDWSETDRDGNTILHLTIISSRKQSEPSRWAVSASNRRHMNYPNVLNFLLCEQSAAQQGIVQAGIIHTKNHKGETPLHCAINEKNVTHVVTLLNAGANIQCLQEHAPWWFLQEVQAQLEKVDLNILTRLEEMLQQRRACLDRFIQAARENNVTELKNILTDPHLSYYREDSCYLANAREQIALQAAYVADAKEAMMFLVQYVVQKNPIECMKKTSGSPQFIKYAAQVAVKESNLEILKWIKNNFSSWEICDHQDHNLLNFAADKDQMVITVWLAKEYPQVLDESYSGSLLMWAMNFGYITLVKYLIEQGYPTDGILRSGSTALHLAVKKDYAAIIVSLLNACPKLAIRQNNVGNTPLHLAIEWGNTGAIRCLVVCKETLQIKNKLGWTPLDCALRKGNTEHIRMLQEAYANASSDAKADPKPSAEVNKSDDINATSTRAESAHTSVGSEAVQPAPTTGVSRNTPAISPAYLASNYSVIGLRTPSFRWHTEEEEQEMQHRPIDQLEAATEINARTKIKESNPELQKPIKGNQKDRSIPQAEQDPTHTNPSQQTDEKKGLKQIISQLQAQVDEKDRAIQKLLKEKENRQQLQDALNKKESDSQSSSAENQRSSQTIQELSSKLSPSAFPAKSKLLSSVVPSTFKLPKPEILSPPTSSLVQPVSALTNTPQTRNLDKNNPTSSHPSLPKSPESFSKSTFFNPAVPISPQFTSFSNSSQPLLSKLQQWAATAIMEVSQDRFSIHLNAEQLSLDNASDWLQQLGELIAQNWPNEVNNKGTVEDNDGIPMLRISTKAPECAQNLQTTLSNEPLFQFNGYESPQFQ